MAGWIPDKTIEDIRMHTDIVDLIGSYINIKRAGGVYKGLCPFHKEKTPSFSVNPQRQFFHCFGCHAGGDIFTFVMKYEGVDYLTAVKILANRAGIAIEYDNSDKKSDDKAILYKIHNEITKFYRNNLVSSPQAEQARQYLAQRQLADKTAEEFDIGYAPDGWDNTLKWGQKHNFTSEQLIKAGLLIAKEDKPDQTYDRFRDRLMFPIKDEQSRVIGFSGRILKKDEKAAKYVNSPETALFHKSKILYALEKARRHIVDTHTAIVCEGQIDVIRCHQAGFNNAVASQGTAFTPQHATILKRYADNVIIVFDPDTAGQNAAIKTAIIFMNAGLAVKIAVLPPGEDPDSLILNAGADKFKEILDNSINAIAFQINILSAQEDISTEIGAMRIADAVLNTIVQSPNAVQRTKLLQEAAQHLKMPATSLQEEMNKKINKSQSRRRFSHTDDNTTGTPSPDNNIKQIIPKEDRMLCEHLFTTPSSQITELINNYLPLHMLAAQNCTDFAGACILAEGNQEELQKLLNNISVNNPDFSEFSAAIMSTPLKMVGNEFTSIDAVKGLILAIWRRQLKKKRDTLPPEQSHLRGSLTCDLHALSNWETGAAIIERELHKEDSDEF